MYVSACLLPFVLCLYLVASEPARKNTINSAACVYESSMMMEPTHAYTQRTYTTYVHTRMRTIRSQGTTRAMCMSACIPMMNATTQPSSVSRRLGSATTTINSGIDMRNTTSTTDNDDNINCDTSDTRHTHQRQTTQVTHTSHTIERRLISANSILVYLLTGPDRLAVVIVPFLKCGDAIATF